MKVKVKLRTRVTELNPSTRMLTDWTPEAEVSSTAEAMEFVRQYYPEAGTIASRHPWRDYIVVSRSGVVLPAVAADLDILCSYASPCDECRVRYQ